MINKNFSRPLSVNRPPVNFSKSLPVQNLGGVKDAVRLIALGGFGDVTQNMFVYEYVPRGDLLKVK